MFGAYEVVQQPVCLFSRVLQHAFAGSAEGNLVGLRGFRADREAAEDVAATLVEVGSQSRENPAAKPVPFVQHAEEDVLGLDGAPPELADRRAGIDEDRKRSLSEPIEHSHILVEEPPALPFVRATV